MLQEQKKIVVLYYTRGVYPLRDTIRTHLYCWKQYSRHHVSYINVAFGFPEKQLRALKPDVIIFHTIYLSMRWAKEVFDRYTTMCDAVAEFDCMKIALPQDEFIHTDLLGEYLGRIGITHIGTCAYEQDWKTIYRRLWDTHQSPDEVKFKTVLTGYLDDASVARIEKMKSEAQSSEVDIGYRAWKAQFWLGEHGMHKVWVAEHVAEAAEAANLVCDISMEDADALSGDDWFRFLLSCRTTIGVEGGASLCDHDGSIRDSVDKYLEQHPSASFEETRQACFNEHDNTLGLACISPRHLEACVTETCQVLIEGRFSDILKADRDYIAISRDYSNLESVIAQINDASRTKEVAESAYKRVVTSGNWTYREFVRQIEDEWIEPFFASQVRKMNLKERGVVAFLNIRDHLIWKFIESEVNQLNSNGDTPKRYSVKARQLCEKYLTAHA